MLGQQRQEEICYILVGNTIARRTPQEEEEKREDFLLMSNKGAFLPKKGRGGKGIKCDRKKGVRRRGRRKKYLVDDRARTVETRKDDSSSTRGTKQHVKNKKRRGRDPKQGENPQLSLVSRILLGKCRGVGGS